MPYTEAAIHLLQDLIELPSLSREEDRTADRITQFLEENGCETERQGNNVWSWHRSLNSQGTLLLNSHHDTVKPNAGWQRQPFVATKDGDYLYGLGSNDAGGPLVSLLATFLELKQYPNLPFDIVMAATAEEEISGKNGIASIVEQLGPIHLGIIGEPTQMQMGIAEKGLMVLDCEAIGQAGHAAREEGVNAIYAALPDIDWFRSYTFPQQSDFLGPVKMSVTQIEAGSQHNVVPDRCRFVVDVRTNEFYNNAAALEIIQQHTQVNISPRSLRLNSSRLPLDHPFVLNGQEKGLTAFGSPTLSDQALLDAPTLKIGPGDSARSHTADEYILLSEIEAACQLYPALIVGYARRAFGYTAGRKG